MSEPESVKIKFDGRIASKGHIYFYEYSRSQYATSRFLTTVERFRREGRVIDRVTQSKTIEMIVAAPEKGSFVLEILVPVAAELAPHLAQIPFRAFMAFIWSKLMPPNEKRDQMAVKLAEIELKREQERTKQISAQQDGEVERFRSLERIVESQAATNRQMLELLDKTIERMDSRVTEAGYSEEDLIREREFTRADIIREDEIEKYESQLSSLDRSNIRKLTQKLRPMVGEMALPLRSSAERFFMGSNDNEDSFVRLDSRRALSIEEKHKDEEEITAECIIRSYDKFTGRGKVEADIFEKTMYFSVPQELKSEMRTKILQGMDKYKAVCAFTAYRDVDNNITSLVLEDVIAPDMR